MKISLTRLVVFFLILFIVPNPLFCQEFIAEEIDTLSLNDLSSKDIITIGSKNDLLQKMGTSKKTDKNFMWCFREIKIAIPLSLNQ